jgi:hypothetical protein
LTTAEPATRRVSGHAVDGIEIQEALTAVVTGVEAKPERAGGRALFVHEV